MTFTLGPLNGEPKHKALLEPLPTLSSASNGEKLDAGLRSLDHCKLLRTRMRLVG